MRVCFLMLCLLIFPDLIAQSTDARSFDVRIVADKLSDPWDVVYAPDSTIWVTESKAYRVTRILPDGRKQLLLDLSPRKNFDRYDRIPDSLDGDKPWPQAGLMGMALHPDFSAGKPFVYLAYIYRFAGADARDNGCKDRFGGCFFFTRIERYRYDSVSPKLLDPVTIADSLPGSNDHNGGRLMVAPVGGMPYLFYSIGDMGAGQFINAGRRNYAQDPERLEGKILRFNLAPEGGLRAASWIPADNPFGNAVYSLGHRNPQGLTYGLVNANERVYSCEHGPFSDDEVNLVEKGQNYGHPLVIGYNDGNYDGLAAGVTEHGELPGVWHSTYPFIRSESANARSLGSMYRDPLHSFFATNNKKLTDLLGKIKRGEKADWLAEAPSSIAFYDQEVIPGWKHSLIVTTLKGGKLIRLQLDSTGTRVLGDPEMLFKGPVRYRDIAFSPDGSKMYLALDSTAVTSGPTEENPKAISYRGVILEYKYAGKRSGADNREGRLPNTGAALQSIKASAPSGRKTD